MGAFQSVAQTLERVQALAKAGISTSSGLVYYDLENQAKLQYPVLAPIRKRMPRVGAKNPGQGLAVHWNIITNPNSTNMPANVSEGKRSGVLTPATAPKIATYKAIGLENVVTWEADYAAEGYDDARAIAQRTALDSLLLAEEPMLLWGNSGNSGTGLNFGTTPTPAGTGSATGGSLATGTTYYVYCVALTLQGLNFAQNAGAMGFANAIQVVPQFTRTNADNTTDTINGGAAAISAASSAISVTSGGSVGSITATVTAVKGAAGYAWFVGSSAGAANAYFSQLTTINKAVIQTVPSTGQTANYTGSGTDYSANPLSFDGLIPQALASTGYFNSLDGAAFTSDGANGINEINTALKYFWDTCRTSPTRFYAGSGTINSINKIIASNTGQPAFRIQVGNDPNQIGNLVGSMYVGDYLNRFSLGERKAIPVDIHPNIPDGHLFMDLEINPYPTANIGQARAVRTRRDYFQVIWPVRTRQWENGIYADQCLQVYVPYGMGLISNVANS